MADDAKDLARRLNLIDLLCDAHPLVTEPSVEESESWSVEQVKEYFASGGEKPAVASLTDQMETELEPTPLPPPRAKTASTRASESGATLCTTQGTR